MMAGQIGFYVHHHGQGHRNRARAIVQRMQSSVTILSTDATPDDWQLPQVANVISLESDTAVTSDAFARRDDVSGLHYAPVPAPTITSRMAQIANWCVRVKPRLLVVDVSVEVTLLARLLGVRTVVMRQHGDRNDLPHRLAYESADRLLAPFPQRLEDDITPDWVREKTCYAWGFSRFTQTAPTRERARRELGWRADQRIVLVMSGQGGTGHPAQALAAAARANPEWRWIAVGKCSEDVPAVPNLDWLGWVDDPLPLLSAADVVISAAGHNSVMECAHARSHLIAIAEERPFDEQLRKVKVLERERLAIGLEKWPGSASDWTDHLEAASQLDPGRWEAVCDPEGAIDLSTAVESLAYNMPPPSGSSLDQVART